jgi:hypothetical protein
MEGELLDAPAPTISSAAAAAAALAAKYAARKKTAKLLISATEAAAIEMPTYAFPSTNYSNEANVSVTLYNEAGSKLGLVFPYFETLMYDPVVYFTDTSSMGILEADSKTPPVVMNTTSVGARRRAVNAAPALSMNVVGNMLLLLLGVILLV